MLIRVIALLIFFATFTIYGFAQGDLLITPNRIVFEGRQDKQELNLINTGQETTTYSISFVQRRMNEDGSFTIIEEAGPGQLFADPFLKIYPRQVTLQPGEAQVVMVQCKRRSDMADGEYRSHLYMRSEKDYKPLGSNSKNEDSTGLQVQLIPIFGISIPIIIRNGKVEVKTTLTDLRLEYDSKDQPMLKFNVNREGNASIYGNFVVEYVPKSGSTREIGYINGIGIYTDINQRFMSINLNVSPGTNLNHGKLILKYKSRTEDKRAEVYAQEELIL